jgi:hypothetical protein
MNMRPARAVNQGYRISYIVCRRVEGQSFCYDMRYTNDDMRFLRIGKGFVTPGGP